MGRKTGRWPVRAGAWVIALVLAVAGISGLVGGENHAAAEWGARIDVDTANIRAEPGLWGDITGQAWLDEWVTIHSGPTESGWYEVAAPGGFGWVEGSLLALGDGAWAPAWGGEASASGERWIDVDRSSEIVTLYEGDAALRSWWGAMSADPSDDGFFATAPGTYQIYEKREELAWTDFGQAFISHWVGFDPDRLNGFHSWSLDENGWVIPGGDGPTGGCVALAPEAATDLFWFAEPGMRVEVHW